MENKSRLSRQSVCASPGRGSGITALIWLRGTRTTREYVVVTKFSISGLNPGTGTLPRDPASGKVMDIRLDSDSRSDIAYQVFNRRHP